MKRVLIYVFAVFALSSLLMSCDKEENTPDPSVLGTPELRLVDTYATSVTVEWDAVENAASYEVKLNNDESNLVQTTETEYEVSTPEEGTYIVQVRALPGEGENYLPSAWSDALEYELTAPEEPEDPEDPDEPEEPVEPVPLEIPVPDIGETTDTYFIVSWEAVENAVSYEYTVNDGEPQSVTETSVQISTPEAGTYTVKVRALPEESSEEFQPSDWAFATFTIE